MLLAIDIGNSTIALGLFEGAALTRHWRLRTEPSQPADEYRIELLALLAADKVEPTALHAAIISSVVPTLTPVFQALSRSLTGRSGIVVSPDLDTGLRFAYRDPSELGSDRIVNAAAALALRRTDTIVVDLGTATTFSVVTAAGEFLGGAIAPGLGLGVDALAAKTARLPRVELQAPRRVIGTDTVENLRSGVLLGHAGMVDRLVTEMQQDLKRPTAVVATGGHASLVAPLAHTIEVVRPFLTLEGLELIFRRNAGPDQS